MNADRVNSGRISTDKWNMQRGMQQPNGQRSVAPERYEPAPVDRPAAIERPPPAIGNDRLAPGAPAGQPSAGQMMRAAPRENVQRVPQREIRQERPTTPRPAPAPPPHNDPRPQQQRTNPR